MRHERFLPCWRALTRLASLARFACLACWIAFSPGWSRPACGQSTSPPPDQGQTQPGDQVESIAQQGFVSQAERGLTGSFTFRSPDLELRAKPQRDVEAPISLRLRSGSQPGEYEARFVGSVEGEYDLRDLLQPGTGFRPEDLPRMQVNIVSTLPDRQQSNLFDAAVFEPSLRGGYRVSLVLAIVAWAGLPVILLVVRRLRRPIAVQTPGPQPPPSLAEQLSPLVEAAASRPLSAHERGRLELLLVHYWRERAEIPALSMAESIARLRQHPEAGPLLNAVETWLHGDGPASNADERLANQGSPQGDALSATAAKPSQEEILRLLQPYQLPPAPSAEPLQAAGGGV